MGHILSIGREKLNRACIQLHISQLDENDYVFLEEYYQCISPVAHALKTLEGNRFSFALYLPVLMALRSKFNELKNKNSVHCDPLIDALENGYEYRFNRYMDIYDAEGLSTPLYIAMATNPCYKLNFLGFREIPSHISQRVRNMLLTESRLIHNEEEEKRK